MEIRMKSVFSKKFIPYLIVSLGVIYGIWPMDAIPDIPIIGWIDDMGVIGTTILIALSLYYKNKKETEKFKS